MFYSDGQMPHLADSATHALAFCTDCRSVTTVVLVRLLVENYPIDESYCLRCERLEPDTGLSLSARERKNYGLFD